MSLRPRVSLRLLTAAVAILTAVMTASTSRAVGLAHTLVVTGQSNATGYGSNAAQLPANTKARPSTSPRAKT